MKRQQPTLRFLGATDTVTGSRYLLKAGGKRVPEHLEKISLEDPR